jgi:hypothetical protein
MARFVPTERIEMRNLSVAVPCPSHNHRIPRRQSPQTLHDETACPKWWMRTIIPTCCPLRMLSARYQRPGAVTADTGNLSRISMRKSCRIAGWHTDDSNLLKTNVYTKKSERIMDVRAITSTNFSGTRTFHPVPLSL